MVAITLAYPNAVRAQTEQSAPAPSSPASSASQTPGHPPGEGEWWGRLEIGGKLGLSSSTFVGEDATRERVEHAHRSWLTIGGHVSIRLLPWLAIQPEVLYVSKGADFVFDGMVVAAFNGRYIELPLLARIMMPLGEQVTPYLLVGPTLGVLLDFKLDDYENDSVTDQTELTNSTDLGLLGGVGVEIAITSGHALIIEGRYDRGLATIAKEETQDLKNSVFAFTLGYQYSLSTASP
jgi:hypothetical protein